MKKLSCLVLIILLLSACSAPDSQPTEPPPTEPVDRPQPVADLQVNFDERSADPIAQNGTFEYYVSVRNNGSADAEGVELTVTVPFPVTEVPPECGSSDNTLKCELGELEIGYSKGILISGRALKEGVSSISASVAAATNDPDPSNNSTTESFRVFLPTPTDADLQVNLSERSEDPIAQGRLLEYYANVKNNGGADARGVKLEIAFPFPVGKIPQGCNLSGGAVTCDLGELKTGESKGVLISGQATEVGTYSVTSKVSALTDDPSPSNNNAAESFEVFMPTSAAADLQVNLNERSSDPVTQGELLTYFASVKNNGSDAAEGVKLVVEVPFAVNEVSQECSLSGGTLTCGFDELKSGDTKGVLISGQASEVGLFSVSAKVSARTSDPNQNNNSTTENFRVSAPAPPPSDLSGQVANWSAGATTLNTVFFGQAEKSTKVASGTIGADGKLDIFLGKSVPADVLSKISACSGLTQTNPDTRQNAFSALQVMRGQTEVGRVALASSQAVLTEGLRKVGDYYVQQTYADAANTVTGSCALGGVVDAVFEYDLKLKQGWNTVTFELTGKDGDAQTLELSSGTPQGAAWFFAP